MEETAHFTEFLCSIELKKLISYSMDIAWYALPFVKWNNFEDYRAQFMLLSRKY